MTAVGYAFGAVLGLLLVALACVILLRAFGRAEPPWWDRQARESVWAWTSRIYATLSDTARRANDEAAARPEGSEPARELRAAREAALWAAGNAVGATAGQDRGANRDAAVHKPLWLDGTRNAALLDGIKGPGKPPPRPVTSRAAEHAAAAGAR